MSDLKPCPFCNAKPLLYDLLDTHGGFSVECPTDGCDTEKMKRTKVEVIEAWNRRAQPAQAGQVLTRHEQEDLYRETSNRVAQLEAENRYEFASWFFIAVELVEQAVRAKLGAGVPMTDPQLQTSEERRATGDRILELIEKQHPGIVGEKGGA